MAALLLSSLYLSLTPQLKRWTFNTWKSIINHYPQGTCPPESLKLMNTFQINTTPLHSLCIFSNSNINYNSDAMFRIFSGKTWCSHTATRRDMVSGSRLPSCFPRIWTRVSLTAGLPTSLQSSTSTGCSTACRVSISGSQNWITSAAMPSKRSGMGCQDYLGSNWHSNIVVKLRTRSRS